MDVEGTRLKPHYRILLEPAQCVHLAVPHTLGPNQTPTSTNTEHVARMWSPRVDVSA